MLSQLACNFQLSQEEWCKENPAFARAALAEHEATLTAFRADLTCAKPGTMDAKALLGWLEAQGAAGKTVQIIDPVSAMLTGKDRYVADLQFVLGAKQIAATYGSRIIMTHHGKKGAWSTPDLDNMVGGIAYRQFTDTVLWLQRCQFKRGDLEGPHGDIVERAAYDRKLWILKARHAGGGGRTAAMRFIINKFELQESGLIPPKTRKDEDE